MRVVLDAAGAPADSGGMRLHAEELVRAWAESFPDDELVVVSGAWAQRAFRDLKNVAIVSIKNDATVPRVLGQIIRTGIEFHARRCDALISLSSMVSPLVPKRKRTCFVHDWRHTKTQRGYTRAQLVYRRLWLLSIRHAGLVVSISAKTDTETAVLAPRANRTIVENGRDHPRRWPRTERPKTPIAKVVTFGHHANKRPDLAIRAIGRARELLGTEIQLTILGARGELADELMELAHEYQVDSACIFPGFVSEAEYQRTMQLADLVVLASTDEGFGLPIAEAQYFGIPVVVTADSGLDEIHPGLIVADPNAGSLADSICKGLRSQRSKPAEVVHTWDAAAGQLRRAVLETGSVAERNSL